MARYSRLAKWEGSFAYRRSDNVLIACSGAAVEVRRGGVPITIYSDEAGTLAIANPITLGPNARAEFFVSPEEAEFDLVVQAPAGEFATFTQADVRAFLQGRKVFAVDDFGSFANAVAELTALGIGGEIVLERDITTGATCSISGLSGVRVRGISPEVTITAANGLNAILFDASGCSRCELISFRLDGNGANQTPDSARVGLTVTGTTGVKVIDMEITGAISDGLVINNSTDLRVVRVKSYSNHGHGFVHGATGARATRPHFIDCIAEANGDETTGYDRNVGFDFEPTPDGLILERCIARLNLWDGIGIGSESSSYTARNVSVIDCKTESNAQDPGLVPGSGVAGLSIYVQNAHDDAALNGVLVRGGHFTGELEAGILVVGGNDGTGLVTNVTIEGVKVYECARYGIRINDSVRDAIVRGCHAYNNANNGLGTGFGISAQGGASPEDCRRVSIIGCHAYDDRTGAETQVRGFVLASNTLDCRISDCTAFGNVTSNYAYTNSVNPIVHNNHDL